MKLKELKNWLDGLSENELEKELYYNSLDYGISGKVTELTRSDENQYYVGDDPALLHTSNDLAKRGYSKKQINEMDIEVPAGCYYIELSNEYSILERFVR